MADYPPPTFPTLETARLRLRQITPADTDDWLTVLRQPEVNRYLVELDPGTVSHAQVMGIIGWTERIYREGSGVRWAVTRPPSPLLIGTVGYHLYSPAHRRAEVGYELSALHWRQGVMTEALGAVLRYCFQVLRLHRVEADVTAGNTASAALLRKLGFQHEGTWRDRVYGRGRFHDLWQFSLLATDRRS